MITIIANIKIENILYNCFSGNRGKTKDCLDLLERGRGRGLRKRKKERQVLFWKLNFKTCLSDLGGIVLALLNADVIIRT